MNPLEMNAGLRPTPSGGAGLRPAFNSEEFIMKNSDSKDFFSHSLQSPSCLCLTELRTEAALVPYCPVASVYPHRF